MIRILNIIIATSFLAISTSAQENQEFDINISGKVIDKDSKKAISGATVQLEKLKHSTTTNGDGKFSIEYAVPLSVANHSMLVSGGFSASIHNRFLSIYLTEQSNVIISAYSLQGKVLSKITRTLSGGTHHITALPVNTGVGLYKVTSGNNEIILKSFATGINKQQNVSSLSTIPVLAKKALVAAAFADKLMVTKNDYESVSIDIDKPKKSNITIEMKSKNVLPVTPVSGSSKLIGWAATSACGPNGTTGGEGGEKITVSNGSDLKKALKSGGKKIITLTGNASGVGEIAAKDKTIIGVKGAVISGGVHLKGGKNVIFKNIEFNGGPDTFEMSGSSCVWFDHCIFRDGKDGNLDIVRGSDLITVSWCKFYYTKGHGHMLSNLCGNKNNNSQDKGKINITFHHNWWGAGVRSRQPRVRYGKVHVFNNYYHYTKVSGDGGAVGCVAAGQHSKLLVENNYFDGSKSPIYFQSDGGTAQVVHRGNKFDNTSGSPVSRGSSFEPSYEYKSQLQSAVDAKASVIKNAGPQ